VASTVYGTETNAGTVSHEGGSSLHLISASASLVSYSQASLPFAKNSSYSLTGRVAWTPWYAMSSSFALGADIGAGFPKATDGGVFAAFNAEAMGAYAFSDSVAFMFGGGGELWTDSSQLIPVATAGFVFPQKNKVFAVIDRFMVDYSIVFTGKFVTHQIELGLGI